MEILQNRYQLLEVIGKGGMGVVYKAWDRETSEHCAVKKLMWKPGNQDAAARQFQREAEMLFGLEHINLPKFRDFFRDDQGLYLVMDYVEGTDLKKLVETCGYQNEARVIGWLKQLCRVLAYLHASEPAIVFRDLKPSNIMLEDDGCLKLIDFGIAKQWEIASGSMTFTGARGYVSPGFAAPEQYSGGTEPRSDIYALGATAYFLLTGTVPPESVDIASGTGKLIPIRNLNPNVSQKTARLIDSMLQVQQAQRPASASWIYTQLEHAGDEVETHYAPRWRRKRSFRLLGVGLVTVGTLVAGTYLALSGELTVQTAPAGLPVRVDGRLVGPSPAVCRAGPGRHKVEIEAAGYYPQTEIVAMPPSTVETIDLRMREDEGGKKANPLPGDGMYRAGDPSVPGFYPPSRGPAPAAIAKSGWSAVAGVRYLVPPNYRVAQLEPDRLLVLEAGDGKQQPRREVRLEIRAGKNLPTSEELRDELSRGGWSWVVEKRTARRVTIRCERSDGPLLGRALLAFWQRDGRLIQVTFTYAPAADPYAFVREIDIVRGHLDLDFE